MASTVHRLLGQGRVTPPHWLDSNLHLEVIQGSRAYGANDPEKSDYDIRGVFTPPKVVCFPGTQGLVVGYDDIPKCDGWKQQATAIDGREYDFDVFNICHFLKLARQNNPNMVDLLFAHETLVTHCSAVGRMLLDARHLFLSKLCWKRFRGYAADQFHRLKDKKAKGKRKVLIEQFGYDVKFAYHCIRLLREAEQILTENDLNLFDGSEEYRTIRRGDWSYERLEQEFVARKLAVEKVYHDSKLPEKPDDAKIKQLLLDCLEHHYGSLAKVCTRPDETKIALRDIDAVLSRVRSVLM